MVSLSVSISSDVMFLLATLSYWPVLIKIGHKQKTYDGSTAELFPNEIIYFNFNQTQALLMCQ